MARRQGRSPGRCRGFQLLSHQEPERRGRRGHGRPPTRRNGRAGADAAPARHAPPLLPRRDRLEHAHGRIPGAILSVKLKYIDGWNQARRAVAARYHALFSAAGLAEAGPYPGQGVVLPHEVAGPQARLAPVRHPHAAARCVARVPCRAQDRLGDLLSRPAAHAGGPARAWAMRKAASPRPSAPPAKCWPCPSSPNCAKTSSKRWSRPLAGVFELSRIFNRPGRRLSWRTMYTYDPTLLAALQTLRKPFPMWFRSFRPSTPQWPPMAMA